MNLADLILLIAQSAVGVGAIPAVIKQSGRDIPLLTSVPTTIGLFVIAGAVATGGFVLGPIATALTGILWATLGVQRWLNTA